VPMMYNKTYKTMVALAEPAKSKFEQVYRPHTSRLLSSQPQQSKSQQHDVCLQHFQQNPQQRNCWSRCFSASPVNVARYDQQKYEIFEKLIEKQLSFFWRPEEVDVSRDRIDYQNLPEHEKHIFISNLKYQTLLDSIQGRSPNVGFAAFRVDSRAGNLD
jgi:hypothetical protein